MDDTTPSSIEAELEATDNQDEDQGLHGPLSGTMTAVLLMAAFFVITWFGVYAILLSRR